MPRIIMRSAGRIIAPALVGLCLASVIVTQASAWGHTGHVRLSAIAMEKLPRNIGLPAFLFGNVAEATVGELGAEADVSKSTGVITSVTGDRINTALTVHDAERDPGHYIDIDDSGFVLGGAVALSALPATRAAYDTAQRAAANPTGQTQYSAGYLPYAMIDGYQQLRKDFGIYRVLQIGLQQAFASRKRDAIEYFLLQTSVRTTLILRDIGYWSHFMEDASQPMHVSVHFNGWGNYPNPKGYTTAPIHAPFEGAFVRDFIDFNQVRQGVRGYASPGSESTIEQRMPVYLADTLKQVAPAYAAAGFGSSADLYRTAQPAEIAVVKRQLTVAATKLRDEIANAWLESTQITVGFPLVAVADVLSGKVKVTTTTLASD